MASIPKKPRIKKDGTEVYDIQVFVKDSKQKIFYKTYTREKGITENENKRRLNAFASNFENKVRNKIAEQKQAFLRNKQEITFKEFSLKWLRRSEQKDSKTSVVRNTKIVEDLNVLIGNLKMKEIQPLDIQEILDYLNSKKIIKETAVLKKSLDEIIKHTNVDKLCRENDISTYTVFYAKKGKTIQWINAIKICNALKLNANEYFTKKVEERPYSKGSKLVYRKVLNAIFNFAIETDLIDKNPCKFVLKPNNLSGEIKEKDILSLEETKQLQNTLKSMNNVEDLKKKTVVAMFLALGLRQGELVGLQWKDINWDTKKITINRSSTYTGSKYGIVTKTPKTKTSIRTLPIPQSLMEIILEYKNWYDNEHNRLYEIWDNENEWIFVKITGQQLFPRTTTQWLDYVLNKGGIRHIGCHSLRHTFITTLLREKVPVKVVARFAGHANPNVTLSTYAHFLDEDNDEASQVMDKFLK